LRKLHATLRATRRQVKALLVCRLISHGLLWGVFMTGLMPKYERAPAPSQASQARVQTVVQHDDLGVTLAMETDVAGKDKCKWLLLTQNCPKY